jgi:prepilin-type N-terminal cleavage/methylation domain-containing protein
MKNLNKCDAFTLVEVIVTAVIVAILALVSVQIYRGYVSEAKRNVVEHAAASAATFLNGAMNMEITIPNETIANPLTELQRWTVTLPSGNEGVFICPKGMEITIDVTNKQVKATLESFVSNWYKYDN